MPTTKPTTKPTNKTTNKPTNKKMKKVIPTNTNKTKTTNKTTINIEVPAPAPAPVPVPVPVEVNENMSAPTHVTSVLSYTNLEVQFTSLYSRLQELRSLETLIMSDLRKLQKVSTKYIKDIQRKNKKKSRPVKLDENGEIKKRPPSGFAKPALISPALCHFLGCPLGTEMARTEVTKFLTNYIKEHNLQDQTNRRHIIPDNKLQALLNVNETEEDKLTYFNLQKYMKVHFPASKKDQNAGLA